MSQSINLRIGIEKGKYNNSNRLDHRKSDIDRYFVMMNELPQVSSTTSLSDNPQLRQYYDRFLFKNSSGKSLSDLPAKAREQAREQARSNLHTEGGFVDGQGQGQGLGPETGGLQMNNNNNNNHNHNHNHNNNNSNSNSNNTTGIDFINGFRNPMYQTATSPVSSSGSHRMNISFSDAMGGMPGAPLPGPGSASMFQFSNAPMAPGPPPSAFGMVPLSESSHGHGRGSVQMDYSVMGSTSPQQQQQPVMSFQGSASSAFAQGNIGPSLHSRNNSVVSNSSISPSSYYATLNQTVSPSSQLSPLNSAGGSSYGAGTVTPSNFPFSQDPTNFIVDAHANGRRSSYVADALIHGHMAGSPTSASNMGNKNNANNGNGNKHNKNANNNTNTDNTQQRFFGQQRQTHSSSVSAGGGTGYQPTRNIHQMKHHSVSSGSSGPISSNVTQNSIQQQPLQPVPSSSSSSSQNGTTNTQSVTAGLPAQGTFPLDNGLLLKDNHIVSSPSLSQLYKDCGENFFASKQSFEFIDTIKDLIAGKSGDEIRSKKIQKFLGFLKSCNLNYNPQSDAFVSTGKHRRSSTSSYLHYRPLVLVALKNGKLELLSLPQNTNLSLARNDLIIIDGDRGKDLAVCVEPVVDLELALFINFLKKKIHFDSLITSRNQHYPAEKFIDALMNNANGSQDDLNSKLYDVIELTQLIIPSKQILRFATPWECSTNLHSKFQDELKALHIAQLKLKTLNSNNSANGKPSLNIKILNSEFQFDRKKLTFYYICQERNDFRELIKELFKFYKTRIWLCAIPNNLEIDTKYYDNEKKEWAMYEDMMKHFQQEELIDNNLPPQTGFIVAPSLNKIQLDNFQIGVYKELVNSMF